MLGKAMRFPNVTCPHGGGEAECRSVRATGDFVHITELHDTQYRTENFVGGDAHVVGYVGK